ncbi:Lysozyme [Alteripontixanthobacter maritimus]|uniref:Lysozyme n=1 Tax=Alteripontixanthobacter maritimus TaxID=2161824 RepID=A0A369QQJ1_9SPHN|nr:glycoside hydrolase family protein [Alteripontixanthobacter maritimus]RDC66572.1 Lysozyme [Alteripontixanthobacter maritimus]
MSDRKHVFDTVNRYADGIWNKPGAIVAFDAALDKLLGLEPTPVPTKPVSDFDKAVIAHLRDEEGVRPEAYRDHLGYWTIGIGRLIDPRKGGRITPEEDAILLANDPSRQGKSWRQYVLTEPEMNMLKLNDIERFVSVISKWPAWKAVGDNIPRKVALTSMAFQLGADGLAKFKNSLRMVEQGRFADAADNFMKSKWARQTRNGRGGLRR